MTEYNEWKIWNGGECPVPKGTMGRVQYREENRRIAEGYGKENISNCRWPHLDCGSDIIAYQTVKEPVAEERITHVCLVPGRTHALKYTLTDGEVTKVELAE